MKKELGVKDNPMVLKIFVIRAFPGAVGFVMLHLRSLASGMPRVVLDKIVEKCKVTLRIEFLKNFVIRACLFTVSESSSLKRVGKVAFRRVGVRGIHFPNDVEDLLIHAIHSQCRVINLA